jgi:hypothetical protein
VGGRTGELTEFATQSQLAIAIGGRGPTYGQALTLVQVLKQCGDDLTRENIVRQAANLHDLHVPLILGTLSTSPTDYEPFKSMPMQFDGTRWELISE